MKSLSNLRIVIAGGSGFIGTGMAQRWAASNNVTILTRGGDSQNNSYKSTPLPASVRSLHWDGATLGEWASALDGADILINLAGKSVNCRYTARNKAEILSSRVDATRVLHDAVARAAHPPTLWINSSSATIYRQAEDRPQDEATGEMHSDFSVQVCKAWEETFFATQHSHTRQVALRTAIVLGHGGVLVPYTRLARFGLGGRQGSGRQMFSWIHIDDLCRIVEWLLENENAAGIYNAAAPGPITNAAFMTTIRSAVGASLGLPAPTILLKLGAALIGTESELLLKSRWVVPTRLLSEGFAFHFDDVRVALADLLESR